MLGRIAAPESNLQARSLLVFCSAFGCRCILIAARARLSAPRAALQSNFPSALRCSWLPFATLTKQSACTGTGAAR